MHKKFLSRIVFATVGLVFLILIVLHLKTAPTNVLAPTLAKSDVDDDIIDFEGYDNEIVEIQFYLMINIFAAYLNQKPDAIYLHCDNCSFTATPTIFGVEYGWGVVYHQSDVYRLLVLMHYGGIYLDTDVFMVGSYDKYRIFEATVGIDSDSNAIGNHILIGHKNSRFLRAFYDNYRYNYTSSEWYWNAGYMPMRIIEKHPFIVHFVPQKLGGYMLVDELYTMIWPGWKQMDSIHLLINHRSYFFPNSTISQFDEKNILTFNYTYGYMVREIMTRMKLKF